MQHWTAGLTPSIASARVAQRFSGGGSSPFTMRALDVVAVSSPSLVALDVDADSPRSVDLSPEEAGSSKYRAPTAIDSEVSTTSGNSVRFRLLAGDWPSPLAFSIVQAAKHGTLTCVQADQITISFPVGFVGTDALRFRVSAGRRASDVGVVRIHVRAPPGGGGGGGGSGGGGGGGGAAAALVSSPG